MKVTIDTSTGDILAMRSDDLKIETDKPVEIVESATVSPTDNHASKDENGNWTFEYVEPVVEDPPEE